MARLTFALLLYTGQRCSDVIRLGKQHAKRCELTFTLARPSQQIMAQHPVN